MQSNLVRVQRIAAFTHGHLGGNPAGVALCYALPDDAEMQRIAAAVGYSETAFAVRTLEGWRVRYFAPETEVPFCGHATLALGAALASRYGDGVFRLLLNEATISVEGRCEGELFSVALQSPATRSRPVLAGLLAEVLCLFSLMPEDLDCRIPPVIAHAGADHLVLALRSRELLKNMRYEFATGRALMLSHGICTVSLVYAETGQRFHARNPFASGGVYEDPATGAAAAALAGYLREIRWPHGGRLEILQGDDMNVPSRLRADIPDTTGTSIRISGTARFL